MIHTTAPIILFFTVPLPGSLLVAIFDKHKRKNIITCESILPERRWGAESRSRFRSKVECAVSPMRSPRFRSRSNLSDNYIFFKYGPCNAKSCWNHTVRRSRSASLSLSLDRKGWCLKLPIWEGWDKAERNGGLDKPSTRYIQHKNDEWIDLSWTYLHLLHHV